MRNQNKDDTRRYRRREFRLLVDYSSDAGLRCDYATSISAGGLFIETETPLHVGALIKMRFRLPLRDTLHEVEGRVCWHSEDRADAGAGSLIQAPGIGIAFTDSERVSTLARELEDFEYE
jgi:Tfp pilus assembly protein PilZ